MSTLHCRITPRLLSLSWASFLLLLWLGPLTTHAANLTGLAITPPNPTLPIGNNIQLIATGSFDDGTEQVMAQARQVSAGSGYVCAVSTDGAIKCWGDNKNGQLGNGSYVNSSSPVPVVGINTAVAVDAGEDHACAVLSDGTVRCWGLVLFGYGVPGDFAVVPVTVNGINTAVAVGAGIGFSCALLGDGTIKCWGNNQFGQLGNGTNTNSLTPVTVSGISTAVAISVGDGYSCAVLADGTIMCWGLNNNGVFGNGVLHGYGLIPTPVSGINTALTVSAGSQHTCALLAGGALNCWGDNGDGQLGDGTTFISLHPVPVAVRGIATATAVSVGFRHSCALLADGTARCWGYNYSGELGDGTTTNSSSPVVVSGLASATAISAGYRSNCTAHANGTIRCWGDNGNGQLGYGASASSFFPAAVNGIDSAVALSLGVDPLTCAVHTGGTVQCWGSNQYGQLGNGTINNSLLPVTVSGINSATDIDAGGSHACARLADATLRCWGLNSSGQLGNGTTANSPIPVTVGGINSATAVSAGRVHSCALLADGRVYCWGSSSFGQLGNGLNNNSSTPVAVTGITTAVALGAGEDHNCALLADGTGRCWGSNYFGALGDGTMGHAVVPVIVSGLSNAVAVSPGSLHTCALLADGALRCWGRNNYGQLGNGTTTDSSIPVVVGGLNNAMAVSAGGSHSCAVLTDGTLRCWGYNGSGQLGNGTTIDSSIPIAVSGINSAVAVHAGRSFSCALLADGSARCWGTNYYGELANGTLPFTSISKQTLGYFPLIWNSGNAAVAVVNGVGQVQASASGTTQITASANGISGSTTVTVFGVGKPPVASDVNLTVVSGQSATWTPKATDPDGDPVICRLGTPPANGSATVGANCASGSYQSNPGFIGTDIFSYIANDGQVDSNPGLVTVAVTEPQGDPSCLKQYPVSQFSQTGKDGTLTIGFTGNITSHTNKEVKVCPGTTLKYQTSSTKGQVVCKVKNNTTRGSGVLKINDHIKCTDKPAGKDKIHFKVKSGVIK